MLSGTFGFHLKLSPVGTLGVDHVMATDSQYKERPQTVICQFGDGSLRGNSNSRTAKSPFSFLSCYLCLK